MGIINMLIHLLRHNSPGIVSGIGCHSEHICELLKRDHEVIETNLEAPDGRVQINSLAYTADCHIAITVFFNLSLFQQCNFAGRKIAFIFAEYTEYPQKLLSFLSSIDEIWTTSHWHKNILSKLFSGPIHVIPEGIDPKIFNPTVKSNRTLNFLNGFKFLCVARPYTRKNIPMLVKAFLEEFEGTDAKLILAMGLKEMFPAFKHRQIINIQPAALHDTMAKLYKSCQAFVLPTRAEGWGLPICEAMACGLPVITTLYSGITEFANENLIYPINYNLVDLKSTDILEFNGLIKNYIYETDFPTGEWADPDPVHLKYQMRYVYENYQEAHDKGLEAFKHIVNNFTWEHTGRKINEIL
jgi:glycosyltransferase involved in cell wall biosynthesis